MVKVRVKTPYFDDYGLHNRGDIMEVMPDYVDHGFHEVLEAEAEPPARSAEAEPEPEKKPAKKTTTNKPRRKA